MSRARTSAGGSACHVAAIPAAAYESLAIFVAQISEEDGESKVDYVVVGSGTSNVVSATDGTSTSVLWKPYHHLDRGHRPCKPYFNYDVSV